MSIGAWLRAAAWVVALLARSAMAADAPAEIKIGALYAGSGPLASASMPLHAALEYWADGLNKGGGVYVKGFDRKIPVRLIAYDDQSSPQLAGNLTNQLITRDKVDILLSDSTSVMTAAAVPVARDHKMLLWDVTGSSPNFFSPDNLYIVLLGLAATDRYPRSLAEFVGQMPQLGIKSVAILYTTADYTAFQATAARKAVLEFGYAPNEIAFLRALGDNDTKFKFLFTTYGLTEYGLMQTNGVADQLVHTYALASPAVYEFKVGYGLNRDQFKAAFEHWVESRRLTGVEFGYNALAGYQAGLVIERSLAVAASLDQLELRRAVFTLSGTLQTLAGPFELAPDGSQSGLITPLAQIMPGQAGSKDAVINVVWPADLATAKPIYPAP